MQELALDGSSCLNFEQDIDRHHDRGAAVLLQQRFDVLDKVEVFVGSRRPEVVTFDDISFLRDLAFFADDRRAAPGTG